MFYIVSEIQEINSSRNVINYAFDDLKAAEAKYYSTLAAATQSKADYIGATMTLCDTSSITMIYSKCYNNRLANGLEE